jgi:hypothetical protein
MDFRFFLLVFWVKKGGPQKFGGARAIVFLLKSNLFFTE